MNVNAFQRARIFQNAGGTVTVEETNEEGDRVATTYFVMGRYVHEWERDGRYRQVCEYLSHRGTTLRATSDTLLAVIRREHRRAQQVRRYA